LTSTTATLASAPPAGCLAAGDEVLLINLQGTTMSTANIGVFEDLHVLGVSGSTVTFTAPKTRNYGDGASDDMDIGVGATQQKVALVRVPVFGKLDVPAGASLKTSAWNGLNGGVLAIRAASLTVEGTITSTALGYAQGMWSQAASCATSVATTSGESIDGLGTTSTSNNLGGSGGLGTGSANFAGNTPLAPSAGHAAGGQAGGNPQDRALGSPGSMYGVGDGTRLTLGSGAGGDVTCDGLSTPHLITLSTASGGIVALFGGSIALSGPGSITSSGAPTDRAAASGGYVLLRGDTLSLGASLVTAKGSSTNPQGPGGITNVGSDGYVAAYYRTSITGTTNPIAAAQQTSTP
jgi:hypothetical protein